MALPRLKNVRLRQLGFFQAAVNDPDWDAWLKEKKYKILGMEVAENIRDGNWWRKVKAVLQLCAPIMSLLRMVDGSDTCISKVYYNCSAVEQHLEKSRIIVPRHLAEIQGVFTNRWNWLHSLLHAAGYLLDPDFQDGWLQLQSDPQARSATKELDSGLKFVFKRLTSDDDSYAEALLQFGKYVTKDGSFADEALWLKAQIMPAWKWWLVHGGHVPELQKISMRVLAQPTSASASERNWSMYSFIHSQARNKLSHARADKFVCCFSNLKLLVETMSSAYQDEMVPWQGAEAEEEDSDGQPTSEDEAVVDISESEVGELASVGEREAEWEGEGEEGRGVMGEGYEEVEIGSDEDSEQPEVCEQPRHAQQVEGKAAAVSRSGRVCMPSRKAMS